MELTNVGLVNIDYGNYGQMDDLCFFASSTTEVKVVSENKNEKKVLFSQLCVYRKTQII